MISSTGPNMQTPKNDISTANLSSDFRNLSLTDDLADMMKLSILMKCHKIHKEVHNVTIGPKSTVRVVPTTEKKALWSKTKSHVHLHLEHNSKENSKLASSSYERPETMSTRNETSIVHIKALTELESRRRQDLNASIEKRRQKFIDFERKQREDEKISWQSKQEIMIKAMQQQEIKVEKILQEHSKEVEVRNRKIENHYKQLSEKRIKEERDKNETKKIKKVIDGIFKFQSEFTVIYNDIADDIQKMSINQRGDFGTHITTLDELHQLLETIVAKCKISSFTLQHKDLSKCSEIIDLASKVRKQIHDFILTIEQNVMKEKISVELQTSQTKIFNESQPAATFVSPPHQAPQSSPIVPARTMATAVLPVSSSVAPLTTQPLFVPNNNPVQLVPKSSPQSKYEPPIQSIAPLKLEKYVNKSSLEKYISLQNLVMQKDQISKQIIEDPALKSFRNDCKKAVNMPVNTLTDATPTHVLDKYNKLNSVLSGKTVEISGDHIHVGQHPHGVDFCMNLLAKKLVLQGDLIVSSNTAVSAFNYASVILTLWNDFPEFGDLLLGHFYRECPYLFPFYPPHVPGQTEEEFARSRGYQVYKGELEGQDIFLKRMVGYMRLYAATLVASPKHNHNSVSYHSMAIAWEWLASILNLQPRADITATMIHAFLETVGFKMQQVFGKQFDKLITFLSTEYMAKIKSIDTEGPVSRLELILQEYAKDGTFPEPEGMLPTNFW